MGSVTDTVDLERRTWLTHYVVDNRIIAAALDVARNQENSVAARLYALRTLIWQKAPGHLLTIARITDRAPANDELAGWSSYTSHYYTDLGYGTGEHPWPVFGIVPEKDYVARLNRTITEMRVDSIDDRVGNARAWFLWFEQDSQLAELLDEVRSGKSGAGHGTSRSGMRLPARSDWGLVLRSPAEVQDAAVHVHLGMVRQHSIPVR